MPDNQDPSAARPVQEGPAYPRPYANARLNSRLSGALPDGVWETRWRAALDPFFPYQFVLQAGDRIMLQGRDRWHLFDPQGQSLAMDNFGDSDVVLDETRALAYLADRFGRGMALRLANAEPAFVFSLEGTNDYRRTFLARLGDRMVVTSFMRPTNPHDPVPPRISVVEVYGFGEPPRMEAGILLSAVRQAIVYYEVEGLLAALHDETLVLAMPDRVVRTDLSLHVQSEYGGAFTPLAMSLDEAGRVYLIVHTRDETGQERPALWVLGPQGERLLDVDLAGLPEGPQAPPVVGYDHRVYIPMADRVLAISPAGEVLWNQYAGGPVAGAVVTADDRLLVTAGNVVIAFDAAGERQALFYLEDDRWTTPPVLNEQGRLLAAAQRHLYCLQIKK